MSGFREQESSYSVFDRVSTATVLRVRSGGLGAAATARVCLVKCIFSRLKVVN